MRLSTLVAVAVAAAFVVPLSTLAQSEKPSSGATAPSAGASAFNALDKDNDGSISREEAKGTPYEKDFSTLDKDSDGKLSPSEHAAAPAAGDKAGAGATSPASPGSSESKGSK